MAGESKISQKEYLKRYLSNDKDEKKKKKRKAVASSTAFKRSQVIDDDVDLKNMRVLDDDEVELYQLDEDAPQIAGIIDERPPEVQAMEYYTNTKRWKVFGGDNDSGDLVVKDNFEKSDTDVLKEENLKSIDLNKYNNEEMKRIGKLLKEKIVSRANISDLDPQKKLKKYRTESDALSKKIKSENLSSEKSRSGSESDLSPPRYFHSKDKLLKKKSKQKSNDSDFSPLRRSDTKSKRKSESDDSDLSPPRKSDNSCKTVKKSRSSSSDSSLPRNKDKVSKTTSKKSSDSDLSPPRKSNNSRKCENNSDSDLTPPRRFNKDQRKSKKYEGSVSSHKRDHYNSRFSSRDNRRTDFDLSPPRRKDSSEKYDYDTKHKYNSSSSSLSYKNKKSDSRSFDYKSDERQYETEKNRNSHKKEHRRRNQDSEQSKSSKMEKTLEGKQAGLQNAKQLKRELSDFKERENHMFSQLTSDVSGKGAATVMRDRKTGQKRDVEKERLQQLEKAEKSAEQNEKYAKWGKGLKQVEDAAERFANAVHEMSKPLARYADDDDLDKFLKAQEREGDPMLDYIRSKQSEAIALTESKPVYKGSFLPNRFGIRPGYRWDGVDRSNGFEKQWFTTQNNRKARDEEAYKWSVSDM